MQTIKVLKGISKRTVNTSLNFDDYMRCLTDSSTAIYSSFTTLQPKDFQMRTVRVTKKSLSPVCLKRYYCCAIHGLPFFSKEIDIFRETGQCPMCTKTFEEREAQLLEYLSREPASATDTE